MNLQNTGKMIADARKNLGLTQNQLGEKLGVTGKAVSKWENGYSFPGIEILPALGKELNIPIADLVTGENDALVDEKVVNEIVVTSAGQSKKKKKLYLAITLPVVAILILTIVTLSFYFYFSLTPSDTYKTSSFSLTAFGSDVALTANVKCRVGVEEAFGDTGKIIYTREKSFYDFISKVRKDADAQGFSYDLTDNVFSKANENGTTDYFYFKPIDFNRKVTVLATPLIAKVYKDAKNTENATAILFPLHLVSDPTYFSAHAYIPESAEISIAATFDNVVSFYENSGYFTVSADEENKIAILETNDKCKVEATFSFSVVNHSGINYIKINL